MADRGGRESIRRVAMLGNHLPRQCGIATFTSDLSAAIAGASSELDCFVLAMNDVGRNHAYPPRVQFEISEPVTIAAQPVQHNVESSAESVGFFDARTD